MKMLFSPTTLLSANILKQKVGSCSWPFISLSLSHSLSHTYSLSKSHSPFSISHSPKHTHTLSFSFLHTHTHTLSLSFFNTCFFLPLNHTQRCPVLPFFHSDYLSIFLTFFLCLCLSFS